MRQIALLWPVETMDADSFVAGQRLLVKGNLAESEASTIAQKLLTLGAEVEVTPTATFSMPANVSLVSLDGDTEAPPPPSPSLTMTPPPPRAEISQPDDEARFRGPAIIDQPMQLEQPKPPARSVEPAPTPLPLPPNPDEAEPEFVPVPGRLLQGAIRKQPMVRLAAGVILALLVGWLAASPTMGRAQRRVAALRAQANADRYRPDPEARANAARLDDQADDIATGAFIKVVLVWVIVGGASFGVWYRVT